MYRNCPPLNRFPVEAGRSNRTTTTTRRPSSQSGRRATGDTGPASVRIRTVAPNRVELREERRHFVIVGRVRRADHELQLRASIREPPLRDLQQRQVERDVRVIGVETPGLSERL